MAKVNRTCRCKNCLHGDTTIDIEKEEFHANGSTYYHKDCWDALQRINEIKDLWKENIDEYVVWSNLVKMLNALIFKEKHDSEYILFAIRYAIEHKDRCKLRYPGGIKYILGKQEIKDAFNKSKKKHFSDTDFKLDKKPIQNNTEFTFKQKKNGFGSIFGG